MPISKIQSKPLNRIPFASFASSLFSARECSADGHRDHLAAIIRPASEMRVVYQAVEKWRSDQQDCQQKQRRWQSD